MFSAKAAVGVAGVVVVAVAVAVAALVVVAAAAAGAALADVVATSLQVWATVPTFPCTYTPEPQPVNPLRLTSTELPRSPAPQG